MPGHVQPRTWLVDATPGHVQPCPATVLTCLLSSRPQVRVLLGAQFRAYTSNLTSIAVSLWGAKGQALPLWLRSLPTLRRRRDPGQTGTRVPVGTERSLASRLR